MTIKKKVGTKVKLGSQECTEVEIQLKNKKYRYLYIFTSSGLKYNNSEKSFEQGVYYGPKKSYCFYTN